MIGCVYQTGDIVTTHSSLSNRKCQIMRLAHWDRCSRIRGIKKKNSKSEGKKKKQPNTSAKKMLVRSEHEGIKLDVHLNEFKSF